MFGLLFVRDRKKRRWGLVFDTLKAVALKLATELDMPLADCARRFGTVTLPENANGWRFHPALGFMKYR